jgi:hypothetical protein
MSEKKKKTQKNGAYRIRLKLDGLTIPISWSLALTIRHGLRIKNQRSENLVRVVLTYDQINRTLGTHAAMSIPHRSPFKPAKQRKVHLCQQISMTEKPRDEFTVYLRGIGGTEILHQDAPLRVNRSYGSRADEARMYIRPGVPTSHGRRCNLVRLGGGPLAN